MTFINRRISYENQFSLEYLNNNEVSTDLMKLLKNPEFYDIEITVGMGNDCKVFKAHSTILRARSSYFNTALSENWANYVNNIMTFKKENISPKLFTIILEYIYGGNIEKVNLYPKEIFDLILAFDELRFETMSKILQEFLIENAEEWYCRCSLYLIRKHFICRIS